MLFGVYFSSPYILLRALRALTHDEVEAQKTLIKATQLLTEKTLVCGFVVWKLSILNVFINKSPWNKSVWSVAKGTDGKRP